MEKLYEVSIENTNGVEDGLDPELTKVICRKVNDVYQNIKTNEVYSSSVIKAKEL